MSRFSVKKRESTVVLKPAPDSDRYVLWDGVREEPYWSGTRQATVDKISERSKALDVRGAAERVMQHVDENGTSLRYPSKTGEYLYGWHEDPILYLGSLFVDRADLVELTRRLRAGLDTADLVRELTSTPE